MKEQLKYNFLSIIPLHCSKFYNCFSFYCAQGCHFFCNTKCSTEPILSGRGTKLKKVFIESFHFVSQSFSAKKFTDQ